MRKNSRRGSLHTFRVGKGLVGIDACVPLPLLYKIGLRDSRVVFLTVGNEERRGLVEAHMPNGEVPSILKFAKDAGCKVTIEHAA